MNQAFQQTLLEKSTQGDSAAFKQLVEAYQQPLFSMAFRLLGNTEDARDAVQETLLKVWQKLDTYDMNQPFSTWLYAITSHHCYDVLKSMRFRLRRLSLDQVSTWVGGNTPEQDLMNKELGRTLNRLLDRLSPKQRLVFVLKEIEQLEAASITAMTGLTGDQVKSNLCQAKKKLRTYLMNTTID